MSSEAWLALWDEEAEFVPLRAQLEGESYSGHEGHGDLWPSWRRTLKRCASRSRRRETPESRWSALPFPGSRASEGVDINVPVGVVQRVRRGKIVYTRLFSEPVEALEAAGLRE